MNTKKTIYLCGPINGCTDEECNSWRDYVRTLWDGGILDPMRRDYRGREDECVNEIVTLDKVDIANSDALLVSYEKPSVGTSMEVYLAFQSGKLVVIVARKGVSISPWLKYHSHKIADSYAEGLRFIAENLG